MHRLKMEAVVAYLSKAAPELRPLPGYLPTFPLTGALASKRIYAIVPARDGLCAVAIAESTVPAAHLGLFAVQFIRSGSRIAIYGGQPLSNAELRNVSKEFLRHIYSLEGGEMLAGHLHGRYDLDHYVTICHLASFANALHPNTKLVNTKLERRKGIPRSHIDINGQEVQQPDTVFLEATRDIAAGEEFFADYARNHIRKLNGVFDLPNESSSK